MRKSKKVRKIRKRITKKKRINKKKVGGTQNKIPKIVHQIWFGETNPLRQKLLDYNEVIARRNGYDYKLWSNNHRDQENFPLTLEYQNEAILKGEQKRQSRWAQVADLARLEILYHHGGIYIDSIIQISGAFLKRITQISKEKDGKANLFIGANEDPCMLDCENREHKKYLSNSFIATNKNNNILRDLLKPGKLKAIDFDSPHINHTTGPYFLRGGIEDSDHNNIVLLESQQVYPYCQQETPYQEARPDPYLIEKDEETDTIKLIKEQNNKKIYLDFDGLKKDQDRFLQNKEIEIPEIDEERDNLIVQHHGPLVIYHSGLGGSWDITEEEEEYADY